MKPKIECLKVKPINGIFANVAINDSRVRFLDSEFIVSNKNTVA
jgi:hypothetical protein